MADPDRAESETLVPAEALDEDDLRVDPLEAGIEPAERWSPAVRHGTTPAEAREGEPHGQRLAQEQPDDQPDPVPERPTAVTPAADLDESVDALAADVEPVVPADSIPRRRADPDPDEHADEAGGSVADALRTE
ncbi:hypothetical protein [Amycolatopsis benzoatilytica]|uniref:hypothetical protein n=1 Tax=Amycolatopsis benzoatilytica TaxID=346045 RepID=UPI000371D91D|nr:hypothetical protein [Amycolatopsis benzoatilytica]